MHVESLLKTTIENLTFAINIPNKSFLEKISNNQGFET